MTIELGSTLPNGAIVFDFLEDLNDMRFVIVACVIPGPRSVEQYATWSVRKTDFETSAGHYFATTKQALKDMQDRSGYTAMRRGARGGR